MLRLHESIALAVDPRHSVYCVRTNRFIDIGADRAAAETALKRYAPEYGPNLVVLGLDDAMACHEAAFRSDPEEITADKWDDMLGVLPPVGWRNDGAGESFKMSEDLTGRITGIYVALDGRYFTFNDSVGMSHADCCARVRASAAFTGRSEHR
jgi:uncharacterized protein DUF1419